MNLLLLLVVPLTASLLCWVKMTPKLSQIATFVSSTAILVMSVVNAFSVVHGHKPPGIPGWLELDGLSALILLLVSWIALTSTIFSFGYASHIAHTQAKIRSYYGHLNLFVFALVAVPVLVEPNLVWIAVELTALFSVLLVGFEDTRQALEAAWKYIVLMFMGAAIALLGFLMLFAAAQQAGGGVFTWAGLRAIAPQLPPVLTETAFLFVLVGFGTKSGFVPMHTWLPDAHSQAPSPVCALLSGVKTTTVLYVILRFLPLINSPQRNGWPLLFGLASIAVAAFLILGVRDYKRMFAFSTVEHMGIIFTAIGLGVPAASAAAMAQIVTHSVTKSFCFLAAGSALLAVQTRDIASVRGLAWSSPVSAFALLLGGLAIGGAPPFAVFLSEFSIFRAGYGQGAYMITTVVVILIVVAFFGMLYHVTRMVFGRPVKPRLERRPLPVSCRASLLLAALPVVLLGVYVPYPLHQLLRLAAATLER